MPPCLRISQSPTTAMEKLKKFNRNAFQGTSVASFLPSFLRRNKAKSTFKQKLKNSQNKIEENMKEKIIALKEKIIQEKYEITKEEARK